MAHDETAAEAMERQLAELRAGYARKLNDRIDEITAYLQDMAAAKDNEARMAALAQVRHHAHMLAGSGATFGFPDVSDIAREVETAAGDVIEGEAGYNSGFADLQFERCGRLREAAQAPVDTVEDELREIHDVAERRKDRDSRQRVLVVMECDADEAAQLRLEMAHFGFDVRVVDHPDKLAGELDAGGADVLVSEFTFSGTTERAFEVLTDLREQGRLDMPLVIHTSRDDITSRLGAARLGARAYLVKPVDMSDLVNALDEVTHRAEHEPFRVLIIDDDESLARHTELVLQGAGMETYVLTDPMGVLDALDDFSPELILLDLYMPACSGSEIASVIRQRSEYAGTPIVFLSGEFDKDKQLSAMELGGDDFLTKPIRPSHLISAVRIRAHRFRELRSFMVRDGMTGLFNHTTAKQLLETEVARAKRSGTKMCLAALDIDHFKGVNDTHGHAVGDRVIKALARLMRQRLRGVDVLGRMGGEEFAAMLPGTPIEEAETVFNQLREAFSDIQFHADGDVFSVTLSCGIAQYPDYPSTTELSDAADKALYEAKRGGRNRVVCAS